MLISKLGTVNSIGQKTIFEKLQSANALNVGNNSNDNNTPAATYTQSTSKDYAGKNLNSVQKNILQLQDQIKSIKTNDNMDSKTKDDLIKSLNSQIEDLQKSLNENKNNKISLNKDKQKSQENDGSTSVLNNTAKDNEQQEKDNISSLTRLGTQLDQISNTSSTIEKVSNAKNLAESELDADLNNPDEQLRLTNKDVINSRESNIEKIDQSLQTAQSMAIDLNNSIITNSDSASSSIENDTDGKTTESNNNVNVNITEKTHNNIRRRKPAS
ncbi:hypothetical protein [Pectinatus sottacetonis]|uniref:hypothetical protein n=1 Tax=Pectinatus sottacetonis TaxID=1002795 RepID=UPI0018C6BB74|nr:hypothetical protein [Pectinatus sottacetonis]